MNDKKAKEIRRKVKQNSRDLIKEFTRQIMELNLFARLKICYRIIFKTNERI